ncbi:MAG: 2-dehydropantoate 2-reductase [Colwellia sp.]|jgi:2-dehydropantoate 2-reductase
MNTVIVGQGAIGLLCYHRLSQSKNDNKVNRLISLLPSTKTSVTQYAFSEMNGEAKNFPLTFADNQTLTSAQLIIICVKSYQVAGALKAIHALLTNDAIIIVTHNGLGTLEEISNLFKPSQCLCALLLTQGAKKVADYHIEHTGEGESNLGVILGELTTEKKRHLLKFLQQGHQHVNFQENIKQAQWVKLAINCVINPISARENIENGKINQQIYKETVRDIIKEVVDVGAREGVELAENELLSLVTEVAERTKNNTSSMRADIINNRRTEIDYINGYIHRLGKKHQLATPMNTRLWLAVKSLEK